MSQIPKILDELVGSESLISYTAKSFRNGRGKRVVRMQFESIKDLETFFIHELIGSDFMKLSSSKAIGSVLLIWDR
jgi:hypothetical protein